MSALGRCLCCKRQATHALKLRVLCAWCYAQSCDSFTPRQRVSCKGDPNKEPLEGSQG